MASKKKKGGKGKKKGKANAEMDEFRQMLEALKKEMESMQKTIKKQNKRISSLETDNKRFKKSLQKLQMNKSDSGHLMPANSMTAGTDIEPSDNEDSKENFRSASRRNKSQPPPKTKPKRKEIKFVWDRTHEKIKAADGGSAAAKPKMFGGTIRFGHWLHFQKNNPEEIASFRVVFDTRSIGQNSSLALGFATKSFGSWVGSNFGQNNSCMIKGTAQFLTTDKIFRCKEGKEYKHKHVIDSIKKADNPKDGFFKAGDDVTVEMDIKNLIGKIWNDSANKDGADDARVFEILLPSNYEIAMVAYLGGSAKKRLLVKEQKFMFDD